MAYPLKFELFKRFAMLLCSVICRFIPYIRLPYIISVDVGCRFNPVGCRFNTCFAETFLNLLKFQRKIGILKELQNVKFRFNYVFCRFNQAFQPL